MFAQLTRERPGFLHFDLTGFIRISEEPSGIIGEVNKLLIQAENSGGNILVPTYSYSYTKGEKYSIRATPSDLGVSSDYLRQMNPKRRTIDGIFSYVAFSESIGEKHFCVADYASFGEESLISEIFQKDGMLMSVGDRLHYSTEIHFLERLLGVSYRFDKIFPGILIDLDNQEHPQKITYFCRDLEFAQKMRLEISFERLVEDLRNLNIIENYYLDDQFHLEVISMQKVHEYLKVKLPTQPYYLMKELVG